LATALHLRGESGETQSRRQVGTDLPGRRGWHGRPDRGSFAEVGGPHFCELVRRLGRNPSAPYPGGHRSERLHWTVLVVLYCGCGGAGVRNQAASKGSTRQVLDGLRHVEPAGTWTSSAQDCRSPIYPYARNS